MGVMLVAVRPSAEVRLTDEEDGTKVIYNSGRGSRGGNFDWLAKQHDRRSKYDPIIEHYAAKYGVDPTLVRAVIQVESDFNPRASRTKARAG